MIELAVLAWSFCSMSVDFVIAFGGFDSNFMVFYLFFLVHENAFPVKENLALQYLGKFLKLAWGRLVSHFELVVSP